MSPLPIVLKLCLVYLTGMVLWSTHHSQIPQQQVSVLVISNIGQDPSSDNGQLSQQFSTT